MDATNFEIFKGTTFSDLMKDVYHNQKKKARQIEHLIAQLQPLVKNTGDATVIVPMIKEYLEVSVKNDDALVKLAAIVQRIITVSSRDDGNEFGLTDEERSRLLADAEDEIKQIKSQQKMETLDDNLRPSNLR
jgi:hypothetical protein